MTDAPLAADNPQAHRFEVKMGDEVAFTEYELRDGKMVLPHTVVPDAFKGQGVGGVLAKAALAQARDRGLAVVPRCSFIAGYIAKHPEWLDIVDPAWRQEIGG